MKNFAVFIDRDGTLNEERGYIDRFDRFRLLPMVTEAIQKLNQNNIPAILITNQSGVARGYFSMSFLNELHRKINKELEEKGSRLDGIYVCPHHPDDVCACRKPKPGMLLKAAKENGISLHDSYVIGDRIIDIELAHSVGAKGILVLTGYGTEEIKSVKMGSEDKPDHMAANLHEAVNWVLKDVAAGFSLRPPTSYPNRILIVKPSSLGDIIHSLPVLWLLRKLYKSAHIGWVVKDVWKDILVDNPLLDEVIILKKGVNGLISAIQGIRTTGYDTVIDLQGLFRSGLISILSGADKRIGFQNAREFAHIFYNTKITVPHEVMHAVDRYLLAANPLFDEPPLPLIPSHQGRGGSDYSTSLAKDLVPHFPLYVEIEDAEWVKDFMINNKLYGVRPIIAINPSSRWEKKRWPAAAYSALINQLIQERKAGIIILGSKEDISIAEEISSLVNSSHAVATGKTSLKTLSALLERIDLLVTNDSGPMHIAAALRKPVVALFGPTDPRLTGPYGYGHIVIRKDMDCNPCLRRPCLHGRPLCMEAITVDEVAAAVNAKLVNKL